MGVPLIAVIEGVSAVVGNDNFKRFMCGTYSDGSTRSLADCINGEVLSPNDKAKKLYKKKKNKKNSTEKYLRKMSKELNRW